MQFKDYLLMEAKKLKIVPVPSFKNEQEIINFVNRLKPGQTTSDDVMDDETGEIFFHAGQDAGDIRKNSKKS